MKQLVVAELRKLMSLPVALLASGLSVAGTVGFGALTAEGLRERLDAGTAYGSAADSVFQLVMPGTVGAIVLGVVVVGSEYTSNSTDAGGGRQITTSLLAVPRRGRLVAAKALALVIASVVPATVAIAGLLAVTSMLLGPHSVLANGLDGAELGRAVGGLAYWTLSALIGFGITWVTRSGVIPLIVLVVNSSVVSVTYLLSKVTSAAHYFPDLAGLRMIIRDTGTGVAPLTGGLVMALWTAGILLASGFLFARRDA
jgi:MprA protease rhombosortase-interaction domain-containing protein